MRGFLTIINFTVFLQVHVLFQIFKKKETIILGLNQEEFIPLLENKKIGLVSNSRVLLEQKIN